MKTSPSSSNSHPTPLNTNIPPTNGTSSAHPVLPSAPRLDAQAFYESLKTTLTKEQWATYTTTMNSYLSGQHSEAEFLAQISGFIVGEKRRLHNAVIASMVANMMRDPPGTDVAAWVSAGESKREGKGPQGDLEERRIKKEVMAISARERRRIKEVHEKTQGIEDMLGSMLAEYHLAKQVQLPDMPPPRSATLNNKTNWSSEILTQYTTPLSSETGEFPDLDTLKHRITSISYSHGLPGGCSQDTASFMSTAAEVFVKEVLTTIITRTRCNGPRYVQTDAYRRALTSSKFRKKLQSKGKEGMGAGPGGWGAERPRLSMHDVRLSLTLGDNLLTQLPMSMKKIMAGGWFERDYEVPAELQFEDPEYNLEEANGGIDGWEGAGVDDRKELRGLLDDCLATGS
ncbi:hypothetical protein EX30DRAFT_353322 [Ascodesmis nigricans]|uniref:Transcriptional co-activator n=1 Tax=Ascodesmis nigricans TaxID=341454 RepID=A0A4S2N7N0_9PEZI|nr:hypothetical protein EX30DRAFT_353322 [Ascodesmis nigricans]